MSLAKYENRFSGDASKIAHNGVAQVQKLGDDQAAFDMATAFMIAYAICLRKLIGPEAAAEVVYIVADTILAPEEGA